MVELDGASRSQAAVARAGAAWRWWVVGAALTLAGCASNVPKQISVQEAFDSSSTFSRSFLMIWFPQPTARNCCARQSWKSLRPWCAMAE